MNSESSVPTSTPGLRVDDTITEAVVSAVADAGDVSPLELQPLATAIDPAALDAVFRGRWRQGTVEFDYHGYRVQVSGSGDVVIRERDD